MRMGPKTKTLPSEGWPMVDEDEPEKVKFTMTLQSQDAEWLRRAYPASQSLQEALRSAINEVRVRRSELDVEDDLVE
jgi:hypothetical protein